MFVLVPPIFSESAARGDLDDVDVERSGLLDSGFWTYLWEPEYMFLTNNEKEKKVEVNYVKLKRDFFVFWSINDDKSNEFIIDGITVEEMEDTLINDPTEIIQEDPEADLHRATNTVYAEGSIIQEVVDPTGDREVRVVIGENKEENTVVMDGDVINDLRNVSNLHFDLEGRYLYYSKFSMKTENDEKIQVYDGKIYRWDVDNGNEEIIFDFDEPIYISFRTNQNKIAYALLDRELGVIDLGSKDQKIINAGNIPVVKDGLGTEAEFVPIIVMDIGEDTAVYEVNRSGEMGDEEEYFRVDLNSLEIQVD